MIAPTHTRSCIAKGNHRVAQNDEPEARSGRMPEMLQDDCRKLSLSLANTPGARLHANEAAGAITTFRQIHEQAQAEAREILRSPTEEQRQQAAWRLQVKVNDVADVVARRSA